jgi:DNA-binding NarL/FixJ family response regulator
MIRVLIADDQALLRGSFSLILQSDSDIEVVGEAEDGLDALAKARRLQPDVVLMDIRMPRMDGIEATRRLVRMDPPPRVVILTTYDLDEYLYEAMVAGASGFLLKDVRAEQLPGAVRSVAAGDYLLGSGPTRRLVESFVARPPSGSHRLERVDGLSEREIEVLTLVGKGRSNTEIAESLYIGESTVKTHINRIFAKLGLSSRVQAVIRAYEAGLVQP